jgi:hypothetical protein
MKLLACCSIALLACGPTGAEKAPDIAGRYEGMWRFVLRDSVLLVSPYGCGFAPCGPPEQRPYVTIICVASLRMQLTGDRVYPFPNATALALRGEVSLGGCTEEYAGQPEGFVGLPALPPAELITVASSTPVAGWYQEERVLDVGLILQNSSTSYGELLGCTPAQDEPPWHFGARLDELDGTWVLRGGVADGFRVPSFYCGAYLLFLESSFRLQRVEDNTP